MKYDIETISDIAHELAIDMDEVAQRKAFLEIDNADIKRLRNANKIFAQYREDFIEKFYAHLQNFDEMREILLGAQDLTRLKTQQSAYFSTLTAGQYDWNYVIERLRVGLTHLDVGLDVKWYLGAYRKYLSLLLKQLSSSSSLQNQNVIELFDSIIKIVSFDMGFAIDTYIFAKNKKVKTLEQQLSDLIHGVNGFIYEFDVTNHKYIYVSQWVTSMLGYEQSLWMDDPDFQHQITHPDDVAQVKAAFDQALYHGLNQEIEYRVADANGQYLWINERINVVKNRRGKVTFIRGLLFDITKRKEFESRLAYLATYDELTGLPNRSYFDCRLRESLAHSKRSGYLTAIMFLDLDGFKDINDSLGHAVGDELLSTIGKRITKSLREQDFAARFGGDEFCIMLEEVQDVYSVSHIANRCLNVLEEPTRIAGRDIYPRASIGIAMFPQDGETVERLLQCADNAMYAAKGAGKHQFAFFDSKMTFLAEQRLDLENNLRQALLREEFELHYQPQIELNSGQLVGVEALIRWRHPMRGLVGPDEFIPVAEKIGLIAPLGEWVLNTACKQIVKWQQQSVEVGRIAINISGSHFCDGTLPAMLRKAIATHGIDISQIELEITESVMQTPEESGRIFEEIRQIGIKVSIDDFGTGFSSLSSLAQLPIDVLKIDRSFVQNMLKDKNYSVIVTTIIAMSRALGFSVVAEGVDRIEQIVYLQGIGCDIVQGYYFSKPVVPERIPDLVTEDYFKKGDFSPVHNS